MKNLLLTVTGGLCLAFTSSATTVEYQLSATGNPDEYNFLFTTDANLQVTAGPARHQALVISFPFSAVPPSFTVLSGAGVDNPIGGVGLTVVVHQPNDPGGANGDLTLLAAGPSSVALSDFHITATYVGGAPPSTLQFQIVEFDGGGVEANFVGVLETGTATLVEGVPEPSSAMLTLAGLVMVGSYLAVRRC